MVVEKHAGKIDVRKLYEGKPILTRVPHPPLHLFTILQPVKAPKLKCESKAVKGTQVHTIRAADLLQQIALFGKVTKGAQV
mgnify:CR=1 FL=1